MFYVKRSYPGPSDLSKNIYNSYQIVSELRSIFHDKCYLCERQGLMDSEVEHFIPHGDKEELKYGWDNLFYVCRRCNSIKGDTHIDLLDCTSDKINVFEEIKHLAYECTAGRILVIANSENPDSKVINTVRLLDLCFNSVNTGHRDTANEFLLEQIQLEFEYFIGLRRVLVDLRSTDEQKKHAIDSMREICKVAYPYSVFWRWHAITDVQLNKKHENLREILGF